MSPSEVGKGDGSGEEVLGPKQKACYINTVVEPFFPAYPLQNSGCILPFALAAILPLLLVTCNRDVVAKLRLLAVLMSCLLDTVLISGIICQSVTFEDEQAEMNSQITKHPFHLSAVETLWLRA
jgi:hypothetical protein